MMSLKQLSTLLFCLFLVVGQAQKKRNKSKEQSPLSSAVKGKAYAGFFDFNYDESTGSIYLKIDKATQLESPFLYVNGLSAGIGSNDIGLDCGQLGNERVVHFSKMGDKIMMVQPNLDYRSTSAIMFWNKLPLRKLSPNRFSLASPSKRLQLPTM